ncbi:MAG: LptF/LptG family permease [Bacteroidales bacterium]|nr:LptF/LptG family permease [Bacteroidales bacterium]
MKILDWYIIKKFLGTFFYSIALLIVIVIVFDVSEKIDAFIKNNAPLHEIIFQYYLNFIPYFINLFIYLFTFISVVFFTSRLAANTEIIAMLSTGISFRRLLYPYMISALFLAVISFFLGNFLIPITNQGMRKFMDKYVDKPPINNKRNVHVQISPNTFVYVESYNPGRSTGYHFSLEKYDGIRLVYKLNSANIQKDTVPNKWTLNDYYGRTISKDGEQHIFSGRKMDTTLAINPRDLYKVRHRYNEMNLFQLNGFIEAEKAKGSLAYRRYEVEKYKRLSSPLAILILTLMGVALSSRKSRGGIGLNLGMGITLAFTYILLMQVSTVFSTQGNLDPSVGAWVPNVIFLLISLYLIKRAPK